MKKIFIPLVLLSLMACQKEMPDVLVSTQQEAQKDDTSGNGETNNELNQGTDTPEKDTTSEKDTTTGKDNTDVPSMEQEEQKPTGLTQLEKFYAAKFTVNHQSVGLYYMQGVYEHVSGFLGNILTFDGTRYRPGTVVSKSDDKRRNSFTVTFKVYDVKDNTEHVEITKTFSGFKTVETMVDNIKIAPRHELLGIIRKALEKKNLSIDLAEALKGNFVNKKWMQFMDYSFQDGELELQEIQRYQGKDQIICGSGDYLDVYLINPRWKLTSAIVKDNDLHFTVQLEMVNQIVLSDVTFQFVVKGEKAYMRQIHEKSEY